MGAGGSGLYGRDSIASCDTYSNPYDLRPQADLARRKTAENTIALSPDSLEFKHAKMERELLEKFKKNEYFLPGNGKVAGAMSLGKFFLVAVLMPTYLFFYGFPRWLIKTTIPPAASVIVQAAQHIQGIVRFSAQWIQNIYKMVTNKTENMFAWNRGSEQSKQSPSGFLSLTYNFIANKINTLVKGIQKTTETLLQKTNSIVTSIYHFVADPIVNTINAQLQVVKNFTNAVAKVYAKMADVVVQQVHQFTEAVKQRFETVVNHVQAFFSPVVQFTVKRYEAAQQLVVQQFTRLVETTVAAKNWVAKTYH